MRHTLQVGHLVFGQVVKAMPDRDAILLYLTTGHLAILPKSVQDRPYRVGDTLTAAITEWAAQYVIISQRSLHYFLKVTDLLLAPLVQAKRLAVRSVATAHEAPFIKIAVEILTDDDPMRDCLSLMTDFKAYLSLTVVFVKYDEDLRRFIANALAPASPRKIRRILLLKPDKIAQVIVEPGAVASFLGFKGLNVAVANKLVKWHIDIKAE
jgi:hypothetical protein